MTRRKRRDRDGSGSIGRRAAILLIAGGTVTSVSATGAFDSAVTDRPFDAPVGDDDVAQLRLVSTDEGDPSGMALNNVVVSFDVDYNEEVSVATMENSLDGQEDITTFDTLALEPDTSDLTATLVSPPNSLQYGTEETLDARFRSTDLDVGESVSDVPVSLVIVADGETTTIDLERSIEVTCTKNCVHCDPDSDAGRLQELTIENTGNRKEIRVEDRGNAGNTENTDLFGPKTVDPGDEFTVEPRTTGPPELRFYVDGDHIPVQHPEDEEDDSTDSTDDGDDGDGGDGDGDTTEQNTDDGTDDSDDGSDDSDDGSDDNDGGSDDEDGDSDDSDDDSDGDSDDSDDDSDDGGGDRDNFHISCSKTVAVGQTLHPDDQEPGSELKIVGGVTNDGNQIC